MNLSLTKDDRSSLLEDVRREIVRQIMSEETESLKLISISQVCGLLDVDRKTLDTLDIPRVTIVAGRLYRYKRADVLAWIETRRA